MPKIINNNLIQRLLFACVFVHFLSIQQLNAAPVEAKSVLVFSEVKTQYNKAETVSNCTAYFEGTTHTANVRNGEVPAPAAVWLFFLALIAFVGLSSKRKL